ncbi:galactokinase [Demequina oxidasica]|uniref:galactokinase n=1 Tax=Demequina oxidasica TaxID=676199 RepID=UPI0007847E4A|nr:galactokinase family protein [Demequina oxidasica]
MAQNPEDLAPLWRIPWTTEHGEARARELFHHTFGAAPTTFQSAPGRVTLIGDHTDYAGGLCLTTVLDHQTFVAARARDDARVRVVSAQGGLVEGPDHVWEGDLTALTHANGLGWARHVVGVLWALMERGFASRGMDIAIDSCVPIGAGLGSSASLQCAVALAVNDCWELLLDSPEGRSELAEAAIDAETRFVQVPTGGLDHYSIMQCERGQAVLLDFATRPPVLTQLPLYFPEYGLCLLVIDTSERRDLRDAHYAKRRASCEAAARQLGAPSLRDVFESPQWLRRVNQLRDPVVRARARHVVTELHRVRLITDELAGTGPAHERFVNAGKAMYRSHASLDVDFKVSTDALNLAVDSAFRVGALGARLVGAGFGGSAIALVRRTQVETTARLINAAFADRTLARPAFLTV